MLSLYKFKYLYIHKVTLLLGLLNPVCISERKEIKHKELSPNRKQ